ncbi:hypothetical protein ABIE77_006287 [Sinorhizobium fredii]
MAPVPRHDLVVAALGGNELGEIRLLLTGARHRLFPDLHQQAVHGLGRLRHGVIELQRRIILVTEQLCLLGPKDKRLGDDAPIVGLAAVFAARRPGPEGLFAKLAVFREGQEGLDDRPRQRHRVFAVLAPVARHSRHRILQEIRQPVQFRLARQQQRPALLVGQHILAEFRAKPGERLVDRGKPVLRRLFELGAGLDETLPVPLQDARCLQVEAELFPLLPQRVDAAEQGRIRADLRVVA